MPAPFRDGLSQSAARFQLPYFLLFFHPCPFSPFPFPIRPSPALPFPPPLRREAAPSKPATEGLGKRCKLLHWGPEQNPGQSHFDAWYWYALKTHLVALISVSAP